MVTKQTFSKETRGVKRVDIDAAVLLLVPLVVLIVTVPNISMFLCSLKGVRRDASSFTAFIYDVLSYLAGKMIEGMQRAQEGP